ncbi:MAG: CBS domain-containing protein [Deltaproteobacteria bacterium]|nr:CBS domain-containing protein [Deltaproteobacteria bacterium]
MFQERVRDIMTSDVISIGPSQRLSEAVLLMAEKNISFLVVSSEENRPIGVISERDVLGLLAARKNDGALIREIMRSPILTVGSEETALSALHQLVVHNIRHLAVVDAEGYLAGVLTLTNFLEHLGFEYFVDIKGVSDIMSRDLVMMDKEAIIHDAVRAMARAQAVCVIVVEDGSPVGIFTERDAVRLSCKDIDLEKTSIRAVMKRPVLSIPKETHVLDAVSLMHKKRVRHLPVVDSDGKISGLVSQMDITRGMELKYAEFLKLLISEQERQLREVNELLEKRVKERTRELLASNKRLQEEMEGRKVVEEELRSLASRMRSLREEERRRIARDIHDDLGQLLTVFKFDLSWIGKRLNQDQNALIEKVKRSSELVETAIERVQKISSELRPTILDDLGIKAAMEWQAEEFQKRTAIRSRITFEPKEISLDNDLSTGILRIFQEALTNIGRHAEASRVNASVKITGGKLVLKVADDGKGITGKEIADSASLGLIGIRERVYPWGGNVEITGKKGSGTTLTVTVPLEAGRKKK